MSHETVNAYLRERTNQKFKDQKLVNDHWNYVEDVIKHQHKFDIGMDISDDVLDLIQFHYCSAFEHGIKHGREGK